MAAQDKGTVMSMNPVTASSFPVNSSMSDAMLKKHGAFHFWEFSGTRTYRWCSSSVRIANDDSIQKWTILCETNDDFVLSRYKGHPSIAHFPGTSANWTVREYSFATYLIVATPWSYYDGISHGWGATALPRYPEYDKPLGDPAGPARVLGSGR